MTKNSNQGGPALSLLCPFMTIVVKSFQIIIIINIIIINI